MRVSSPAGTCARCGTVGRPQTKGLCPRCYAKSRERTAVCADCGLLRLHHRTGRCSRCYRLAHTVTGTCGACGEQRLLWGPVCRRCMSSARARPGACEGCGRAVARLWGRRCARCAKLHWSTGSCEGCGAWASSIEAMLCRACRDFDRHNHRTDECRSCGRHLSVNRYGRCRLCSAARRQALRAGDPDWSEEPGQRGGIQLFFGDLYGPRGRRAARSPQRPGTTAASGDHRDVGEQRLFLLPRDLSEIARLSPSAATSLPAELGAAIVSFGEARGWKPATTAGVSRAMALLGEVGAGYPSPAMFAGLRRLGLPVSRVRELLVAEGAAPPLEEGPAGFARELVRGLPEPMRAEVAAWVEVLEGRSGRSRSRRPDTIRHYLNAVRPALGVWAISHTSLREIGAEDVEAQLLPLQGSRRTMTAVALRSLFGALKARRLVFADPARAIKPGRFPITPVLGLDDWSRSTLLSRATRADHALVILLAGVHALTRADIVGLTLDDVDLEAATITVRGRRRPLDRLVREHVVSWLEMRRERWPGSANPHLLVTYQSAYGTGPVSTAYFKGVFAGLPTTVAALRADRLLGEAAAGNGDPLRLVNLFGLSPAGAMRYVTAEIASGAGRS